MKLSIGIVTIQPNKKIADQKCLTVKDIFNLADLALYDAKEQKDKKVITQDHFLFK